jgi:uncharacterized protein with HEPN domain
VVRTHKERLEDVRDAIDRIERAAAGMDEAAFQGADQSTLAALGWWFLVIGEAIKALPQDVQMRHPAVDWRGFARFRDVLVHQYFRIEPVWLWDAVSTELAPLRAAVAAELRQENDPSPSDP